MLIATVRRVTLLVTTAATIALLVGCGRGFEHHRGSTMGTYYEVTSRCPAGGLEGEIDATLEGVNMAMSTYLPQSELSRFNAHRGNDWFAVSQPLADLVMVARSISEDSDGAFDVTVGPLVNLWGFGPGGRDALPDDADIAAARAVVGYRLLESRFDPPALRKRFADLYVDLSAIAKGYGVDEVGRLLDRRGCTDWLVDIGGEVAARGESPSRREWRIGVEVPDGTRMVQRVVMLTDVAVATSGDYRNYVEHDGVRVAHSIDPRTGRPAAHALASVSVVLPDAMHADGWATALHVLGPEDGFALARARGIAALFVVRGAGADGAPAFEERYTPALAMHLLPTP
jgi:thiamine biosynthesis lipoprotein